MHHLCFNVIDLFFVVVFFFTISSSPENSPHHHPLDVPLRIHTFPIGVWLCFDIELHPTKNKFAMLLLGTKTGECHRTSSETIPVKLEPDSTEGKFQRV